MLLFPFLFFSDAHPVVLSTFHDQVLSPGQSVRLECVASGTPAPDLAWVVDGGEVAEGGRIKLTRHSLSLSFWKTMKIFKHLKLNFIFRGAPKVTGRTTTSSLVLSVSSLSSGEGGWYSCHASNYLGRDERTRRVDVEGPPAARRMPDVAAVAGRDLWAHCPYGGHPIEGIKWSRGGKPEMCINRDIDTYYDSICASYQGKSCLTTRDNPCSATAPC